MTCNTQPRIAVAVSTKTGGTSYLLMDTPGNVAQFLALVNQYSDAQARDLGRAHELRVTCEDAQTRPPSTPEERLLKTARRLAPGDALFVEVRDVEKVDNGSEDPYWLGTVVYVHANKPASPLRVEA